MAANWSTASQIGGDIDARHEEWLHSFTPDRREKKKINNKTAERERERGGGDSSVVQCPDSSFLLKSGPTPPDDSERANSRKVHWPEVALTLFFNMCHYRYCYWFCWPINLKTWWFGRLDTLYQVHLWSCSEWSCGKKSNTDEILQPFLIEWWQILTRPFVHNCRR